MDLPSINQCIFGNRQQRDGNQSEALQKKLINGIPSFLVKKNLIVNKTHQRGQQLRYVAAINAYHSSQL